MRTWLYKSDEKMVDVDFNAGTKPTKKKTQLSTAMERTNDWIFSQEIPSDVTVNVGESSFSLHKFPLVSKCGYIKKLIAESPDADVTVIEITDVPGGAEAFELATKFCYGFNFEMSTENIAMLRCISEYLEMTEDYGAGNLIARTDAFVNEVALKSLAGAVSILHACEYLLPVAENVKLVSRCIDTIATVACKDSQFAAPSRPNGMDELVSSNSKPIVDWWAEDLTILRIDFFQRILIEMMARGFKQYALGPILMLYAKKSLRGLDNFGKGGKNMGARQEHEKRVVLETIVTLLPREKNTISVSFLSMLLRAAICLDTTVACKLDLEKRMGLQLGQAVLDDLLIPSYSYSGDTIFDVDTVQRIVMIFLESEMDANRVGYNTDEEFIYPSPNEMEKVSRLMESYLSEIASDRSLTVSKFIDLAELIPEQSRITEDGMYRAIDIYLKAHPALSDMERKKVCSVMDCQKLSREACAHAAQNDRLPVQTVVQVLYYEQQRLREVVDEPHAPPAKQAPFSIDIHPVTDEVSTLRRENQDLKLEVAKLNMRLKEMERFSDRSFPVSPLVTTKLSDKSPAAGSPLVTPRIGSAEKPPLPRKSFISSVSKKLGKIIRADLTPQGAKGRNKPSKDRRHSIS